MEDNLGTFRTVGPILTVESQMAETLRWRKFTSFGLLQNVRIAWRFYAAKRKERMLMKICMVVMGCPPRQLDRKTFWHAS